MDTQINRICVCGAGTMGSNIALCIAQNGFYTLLYDLNETVLQNAKNTINKTLNTLVEKQKITEEKKLEINNNIQYINEGQECIADIIIEAVIEKLEIKIALFNQLAEINHSEVIFATNTSSLSVTAIADNVINPNRVIGMHFFNPATLMKLVEVVNTKYTNKTTINLIVELAKNLQKTPVVCKDSPGFIVNRVARHYYLEALKLVEQNIGTYENIDALLEATGFKMGPFKLMDLIGNDINYTVSESLYNATNKAIRFKPSDIQKSKVEKGELGKKSGIGYYKY